MSRKEILSNKSAALFAAAAALSAAVLLFPGAMVPECLAPLKYRFPFPDLFRMMPGAAIGAALSGTAAIPLLRAGIAWLCFDSARRAAGDRAGFTAALLSLFFVSDGEQLLFSFFLLLLLDLCLSRQGREDARGAAGAGAALGAAFLIRSPAAPMALACAAHELIFTGGTPRGRAARAAVIISVPFLSLAAWAWLSGLVLGSPVLFEAGRSGYNLVSGVMGAVRTVQGDYYALAGIPAGENLFLWAAQRIAADPLTYLAGVGGRAAFFFTHHPLLTAAAALGVILSPAKKTAALTAAFAAAFLSFHFLFSVETRYFTPALFLLSVAAAGTAGYRRAPGKTGGKPDTALRLLSAAAFLWVVYVNAAAAGAAARPRPLREAALEAELAGTAGPRLLELAAEEAFSARETDRAEALLRKAERKGSAAAAKLLEITRGSGTAPLVSEAERDNFLAPMVFRALELGDADGAAERLRDLEDWKRNVRSSDPAIYARLKEAALRRPLEPDLVSALRYWPEESHRALLSRLSRILPLRGELALKFLFSPGSGGNAVFWEDAAGGPPRGPGDAFVSAVLAARRGGALAAETSARRDEALFLGSAEGKESLLRAGLIAGSEKMISAAGGATVCGALRALGASERRSSVFSETAWRQARLGLREEAKASVECGLRSGLPGDETLLLAVALQEAGEPSLASEIMDRLAAGDPENPRYPAYSGVARMLSGDREGAVRRFKAALSLDPEERTARSGLAAASGKGAR